MDNDDIKRVITEIGKYHNLTQENINEMVHLVSVVLENSNQSDFSSTLDIFKNMIHTGGGITQAFEPSDIANIIKRAGETDLQAVENLPVSFCIALYILKYQVVNFQKQFVLAADFSDKNSEINQQERQLFIMKLLEAIDQRIIDQKQKIVDTELEDLLQQIQEGFDTYDTIEPGKILDDDDQTNEEEIKEIMTQRPSETEASYFTTIDLYDEMDQEGKDIINIKQLMNFCNNHVDNFKFYATDNWQLENIQNLLEAGCFGLEVPSMAQFNYKDMSDKALECICTYISTSYEENGSAPVKLIDQIEESGLLKKIGCESPFAYKLNAMCATKGNPELQKYTMKHVRRDRVEHDFAMFEERCKILDQTVNVYYQPPNANNWFEDNLREKFKKDFGYTEDHMKTHAVNSEFQKYCQSANEVYNDLREQCRDIKEEIANQFGSSNTLTPKPDPRDQ